MNSPENVQIYDIQASLAEFLPDNLFYKRFKNVHKFIGRKCRKIRKEIYHKYQNIFECYWFEN